MATPKIVSVTNPVELLLAQLAEIRSGNDAKRMEIKCAEKELRGGEMMEIRLEAELAKLLEAERGSRN